LNSIDGRKKEERRKKEGRKKEETARGKRHMGQPELRIVHA